MALELGYKSYKSLSIEEWGGGWIFTSCPFYFTFKGGHLGFSLSAVFFDSFILGIAFFAISAHPQTFWIYKFH